MLPTSLVKDARLDYVALGHIHKPQDVNKGSHPPVIYPGSIERVDLAKRPMTAISSSPTWLAAIPAFSGGSSEGARRFIDRRAVIDYDQDVMATLLDALPGEKELDGAIIKLTGGLPASTMP